MQVSLNSLAVIESIVHIELTAKQASQINSALGKLRMGDLTDLERETVVALSAQLQDTAIPSNI